MGTGNRLLGLVGLAALAFACDSDSYRSPTAPSPPMPSETTGTGTLNGTMTIVSASPAGDCVADTFASGAGRESRAAFNIPPVEGTWTGYYSFELLSTQCQLRLVSSQGGYLDLELYPYCDVPYAQVDSLESCDPERDSSIVATRVRMPAPAADGTVKGDGAVVIARWDPGPIAPVDLAVYFDLHP